MANSPNTITVTEIPRQIVEAEIELLIALLDTLDPDPETWKAPRDGRANGSGTNWHGWSAGDDRER